MAIPLLAHAELEGSFVLADKGCDWWRYKERRLVEKLFLKLKAFRRIAARYDKYAFTYMGFLCLASILIWIK